MKSFFLPSLFFKKKWVWFSQPFDISGADMVTFFSYDDIEIDGFKKKSGYTSIIDLGKDVDHIWAGMRKKFVRKQITKGELNGIKVVRDKNFSAFKKIYSTFRKNKNIGKDSYGAFVKEGILFSAYMEDQLIAGGVFLADEEYMRAWALASKRLNGLSGPEREIVGQANRMIIWEAIKFAKQNGCKIFDLGGINPSSQKSEDKSLLEFKEAFGGDRKRHFFYSKIYSRILLFLLKMRS